MIFAIGDDEQKLIGLLRIPLKNTIKNNFRNFGRIEPRIRSLFQWFSKGIHQCSTFPIPFATNSATSSIGTFTTSAIVGDWQTSFY